MQDTGIDLVQITKLQEYKVKCILVIQWSKTFHNGDERNLKLIVQRISMETLENR